MRFLVTSAPGLEQLLLEELQELGLTCRLEPSGAVALESADWAPAAAVLTRSRIAGRVFLSLRRFAAANRAMLYNQVRRIDWPHVFPSSMTLAVTPAGSTKGTDYKLPYAALRIKDAVCDEFRKHEQLRPNVDRHNPDVLLNAFFFKGRCELSVDLCGAALHRRGYRPAGARAPMREHRAAALLRFAGYDGSQPLVDPFCGSGTVPIEAALMATRTAPGLLRPVEEYALTKLHPEARPALEAARKEARARVRPAPAPVRGADQDAEALKVARANADRAGMSRVVAFDNQDARKLEAPGHHIVANPPYGERLEDREGALELLKAFARRLKDACPGSTLALVIPRGDSEVAVSMRPEAKLNVESGSMSLRYLRYRIFAASPGGAPGAGPAPSV